MKEKIISWTVIVISVVATLLTLETYLGTAATALLAGRSAVLIVALTMTMGWIRDLAVYMMEVACGRNAKRPPSFLLPAVAWGTFLVMMVM